MAENFDIFGFDLSDEEMSQIATLDTGESQFFDHRDPEAVIRISSRPTPWTPGEWFVPDIASVQSRRVRSRHPGLRRFIPSEAFRMSVAPSERCGGFAGGIKAACGGFAGAATTERPQTWAKRPTPIPCVFEGFRPCLLAFAKH
jgi:hypothetical protein